MCVYALRGKLKGSTCGAPLCPTCAVEVSSANGVRAAVHYCGAHGRAAGVANGRRFAVEPEALKVRPLKPPGRV